MSTNNIVLQSMNPEELKALIREIIDEGIQDVSEQLERSFGEDDLISSGSARRILGVSDKYFRILIKDGLFTCYTHLKERRFCRGEILEFRNKYKIKKRRP